MNSTTEQSEKRLFQGGYSIFVKQANTLKLGEEHSFYCHMRTSNHLGVLFQSQEQYIKL